MHYDIFMYGQKTGNSIYITYRYIKLHKTIKVWKEMANKKLSIRVTLTWVGWENENKKGPQRVPWS